MTETPDVTRPRVPPQYVPPLYRPGEPPPYRPPLVEPPTPHRAGGRLRRRLVLGGSFAVTAVVALGVGLAIGTAGPPAVRIVAGPAVTETVTAPAASASAPAPPAPTPAPRKPAAVFGDGQWLVGKEIRPGRYRTTVPADSYGCYWERERGTSGQFSDVIANDSVNPGRRVIVTIKPRDKAFKSDGCGTWKRT